MICAFRQPTVLKHSKEPGKDSIAFASMINGGYAFAGMRDEHWMWKLPTTIDLP